MAYQLYVDTVWAAPETAMKDREAWCVTSHQGLRVRLKQPWKWCRSKAFPLLLGTSGLITVLTTLFINLVYHSHTEGRWNNFWKEFVQWNRHADHVPLFSSVMNATWIPRDNAGFFLTSPRFKTQRFQFSYCALQLQISKREHTD